MFLLFFTFFPSIFCLDNPNFVFILADDLDLTLGSVNSMKYTKKFIANAGISLTNAYVNSPICCPSRSSILTGKLPQNINVYNNSLNGGCSSIKFQKDHEPNSIAAKLKDIKGYRTFYAGKYLNQYGNKLNGGLKHVPIGYDWWFGLQGNSKYYNYTISINGTEKHYKNIYFTDQITDFALKFLDSRGNDSFFIMLAPPAAHAPFTSAPRHKKKFKKVIANRNVPFNCTASNKHWLMQMPPLFLPQNVSILDNIHRNRLRTLQAVDEMVKVLVKKLKTDKIINNTYVILSSDNGFHIGQFSQAWDKRQPYESDTHIPFFIRGPQIQAKSVLDFPVSAIDFAPTILDLAGIKNGNFDGKSFKKQIIQPKNVKNYNEFIVVQYWGEKNPKSVDVTCGFSINSELAECSRESWCKCQDSKNNTYTCLLHLTKTTRMKFCKFIDGFYEVYDLINDNFELNNIYHYLESTTIEYYKNKIDYYLF